MNISDFDYFLPSNLIAQKPCFPKDESKIFIKEFMKTIILNESKNTVDIREFNLLTSFTYSKVHTHKIINTRYGNKKS